MSSISQYIESNLTIGQGRHAGQPFKLLPWERRFIRGAFKERTANLTVARSNGKSTLIAAIARCAMTPDAPIHSPMTDNAIVAASFAQGGVIFRHLLHFLRPEMEAHPRDWRKVDSANTMLIEHRPSGARMQVLGAKPDTMHGLAPRLLLIDELARHDRTKVAATLAALRTSLSKIPDARMISLGTRPASPTHPFQQMLDSDEGYSQSHAARPNDPPFRVSTWRRANPSWDHLPDLRADVRAAAAAAKKDPSLMQEFEALHLNKGLSDVAQMSLLDSETWLRCMALPEGAPVGDYILGIDLGGSASMSAAAAYWPATGRLQVFGVFPEVPSLLERGMRDGVAGDYVRFAKDGDLLIGGHRRSDPTFLLHTALSRWGRPVAVVADRYREDELADELDKCNFPPAAFILRGMGFLDGAEDVRRFRSACLTDDVRPPRSALLAASIGEARVEINAAGFSKLTKAHSGGSQHYNPRDDCAAAAILCVAEGIRSRSQPAPKIEYAIAGAV